MYRPKCGPQPEAKKIATPRQPPLFNAADGRLLKEQAYERIKELILTGQCPPGVFLSERKLVDRFSMSKTPIRAALERLEAEGMVAVSPRQGIVVREPSVQEVADQFAIRFALERYVLEAVAGRLQAPQIKQLKANLQQQRQAAREQRLAESIRLDSEFHVLFCQFLGNQEILRVVQGLRERMTLVIASVFRHDAGRMTPNWQEHRSIADAVIAGDADEAVARLKSHLDYGKRMLMARP